MPTNASKRVCVVVCHHKASTMPQSDALLHIHVGRAVSRDDFGIQGDDDGDNISSRNANFCELTAHYWAWKNMDLQVYGLFHYRRYMHLLESVEHRSETLYSFHNKFVEEMGVHSLNILDLMSRYDVVVPELWPVHPVGFPKQVMSIYDHYALAHNGLDMDALLGLIRQMYPHMYSSARRTLDLKEAFFFNMFIMRKEYFHEYSEFLFTLLFALEKQIEVSPDSYQKRVFGFLSERLLNIYVRHKIEVDPNFRVLFRPVVFVDEGGGRISDYVNKIKKRLCRS